MMMTGGKQLETAPLLQITLGCTWANLAILLVQMMRMSFSPVFHYRSLTCQQRKRLISTISRTCHTDHGAGTAYKQDAPTPITGPNRQPLIAQSLSWLQTIVP